MPDPVSTKKWWQSNVFRGIAMIVLTAVVQYAQQKGWIAPEFQGVVTQLIQEWGDEVGAIFIAIGIRSAAAGNGNAGAPIAKSLL